MRGTWWPYKEIKVAQKEKIHIDFLDHQKIEYSLFIYIYIYIYILVEYNNYLTIYIFMVHCFHVDQKWKCRSHVGINSQEKTRELHVYIYIYIIPNNNFYFLFSSIVRIPCTSRITRAGSKPRRVRHSPRAPDLIRPKKKILGPNFFLI